MRAIKKLLKENREVINDVEYVNYNDICQLIDQMEQQVKATVEQEGK